MLKRKTSNQATQVNVHKNIQMTAKITGADGKSNHSLNSNMPNGSSLNHGSNHMSVASKKINNETIDKEKLPQVNNTDYNEHKDQSEQTDLTDVDMESNTGYLRNLNQAITCALCSGYLINATTIIDCLDTFCRSCIVNYLETSNSCPICDTPLNKIKPHQSLRSDIAKQTMIYKVAPQVFFDEMIRRQIFYRDDKFTAMNKEDAGLLPMYSYFRPNDKISMSLEYLDGPLIEKDSGDKKTKKKTGKSMATKNTPTNNRSYCFITAETTKKLENEDIVFVDSKKRPPCRYFNCPAALPILQLKKLILNKFEGDDSLKGYNIEIFYAGHLLKNEFTLMEVAYTYNWGADDPMRFTYCFVKIKPKNQPQAIENSLEESSVSPRKSSTRNYRSAMPSSLSTNKSFNTRSSTRGNSSVSTNTTASSINKAADKINLNNIASSSQSFTSNNSEQTSVKVSGRKTTSSNVNTSLVPDANSINSQNNLKPARKRAKLDNLETTEISNTSNHTPTNISWIKTSSSSSITVSRTKNGDYVAKPVVNSFSKINVISGNKRPRDENCNDTLLTVTTSTNNPEIIKFSQRTVPKSSSVSIPVISPSVGASSISPKKDSSNHNHYQKNQTATSQSQNNSQTDSKKSSGQKQSSPGHPLSPPSIRIKLTTSPNSSPSQLFGQIISPIPPEVQNELSQSSKNDISSSSMHKQKNNDEIDESNKKHNNLQVSNTSNISVNVTATNTTAADTMPHGYKMVTSQGVQSCSTTDPSLSLANNTSATNEISKPRGKLIHDIINKMTSKSNFKTSCLKSLANGTIGGHHASNKPNPGSSSLEELINANKSTISTDNQQLSTSATKSSGNLVIRISTKSLESKKILPTIEKSSTDDNSQEKLTEPSSSLENIENISGSQCSLTSKTISTSASSQLNLADDDDNSNEPKLIVDIDHEDDHSDSDSSRMLIIEETDQSEIDSGRGSSNGSEINYAKANESTITDNREVVSSPLNKSPSMSNPSLIKPINASPLSISSILSTTTSSTINSKSSFSDNISRIVPANKTILPIVSINNKPFLGPLDLSSKKSLQPPQIALKNFVTSVKPCNNDKNAIISFQRKSLASKIVPPLPQQMPNKPLASIIPITKGTNAIGVPVSNNLSRMNNKIYVNKNNISPISSRIIGTNANASGNIPSAVFSGIAGYTKTSTNSVNSTTSTISTTSTNWNPMMSNLNNRKFATMNEMFSKNANLALNMLFNSNVKDKNNLNPISINSTNRLNMSPSLVSSSSSNLLMQNGLTDKINMKKQHNIMESNMNYVKTACKNANAINIARNTNNPMEYLIKHLSNPSASCSTVSRTENKSTSLSIKPSQQILPTATYSKAVFPR